MSRIDFVLICMVADLIVNAYPTTKFMCNKTFCQEKYHHASCKEGKEMSHTLTNDTTPLKKAVGNDKEAEV
jgi:hypothetical protein